MQANLNQPTIGPASNVAAPAPLMRANKEHAMTLSEERLKAGKERVEVGRARLRK